MYRRSCLLTLAIGSLLFIAADEPRNPFGVPDISDPMVDDVNAHADRATLDSGDKDPNAAEWPAVFAEGDPMKLDGMWVGRWNNGDADVWSVPSDAKIVKRDDRLFILQGGWYVEAVRQRDGRYAGRWVSVGSTEGGGTWVGRIVNDQRIDGDWATGRWDFRRKFK